MRVDTPSPTSYAIEGGCGRATFGPELRDYIVMMTDKSFPIVNEAGDILYNFHITDELRKELSQ